MEDVVPSILRLAFALFLVFMNGVFVAAEFSLVKVRATRVEQLVQEGRAGADSVKQATQSLDTYLAITQLGITFASLSLGWIGEPAVATLLEPLLALAGFSESAVHPIALVVGFLTIVFLHVVVGELMPKSIAIQKSEGTSLLVAPLMRIFYYLFLPGIVLFNGTANAILRLLGFQSASDETELTHSEQELRMIIASSTRHGVLEETEEEMLEGVFDLQDTVARQIMVPRPDVVSIPADTPLRDLLLLAAAGSYTRYPVFEEESPDRIIGAVHVKDILRAVAEKGSDADLTARSLLLREVLTVPENRHVADILRDFQRQKIQMAIVIDEWGSLEGLITIEDILEEIVGEIRDEFDVEEPTIQELKDGTYTVDGRIPIQTVNDVLGSQFESEDFDTVGGLVLGLLGRVPKVGDEVRADGHVVRVESVDGPRVARGIVREEKR